MDRAEVMHHLIETIRQVMPDGIDAEITNQTCPIADLGLESMDGVECACILSDKLGFKLPMRMNPIVKDGRVRRPMRIGEIADALCELVNSREEINNVES